MANVSAKGIIIKQSAYGDGHRILSIFAEGLGIVKAVSYGAGKSKSSVAASSQFLCYGDFDLYRGTGRMMNINRIDTIDGFYPVCEDIYKLSLASYLSDITYETLGDNNCDDRILRLYLNAIYALAYRGEPLKKVKTAYELKLMAAGGYYPALEKCVDCGNDDIVKFDFEKGGVICGECKGRNFVKINGAVLGAMRYITGCDDKKMLAFSASDELLDYLNAVSETYVSVQLDKNFKSLDYYKTILLS